MKLTLGNILLLALAVIGLAYIFKKWQQAKAEGRPLTLDDILSTPTQQGIGYNKADGKCYQVKYNSITGQKETTEIALTNCYKLKTFQNAIKAEWENLQNLLASPPNPNDPNDQQKRNQWTARALEIKNIFKQIYNCQNTDDFDFSAMACVPANQPPQV